MNTFIGGLLVLSLLSRPTCESIKYAAYDVFKEKNQIICVIKKDIQGLGKEDTKEIDNVMKDIEYQSRNIKSLLKEKNKVFGKIQTALDLRVYSKKPMSENEIDNFNAFTGFYEQERSVLTETFKKIDYAKELTVAKNEMLHKDTDYDLILKELSEINKYQGDAIHSLNKMIEYGEVTLNFL